MVWQAEETQTVDCYIGGVVVANTPYECEAVDVARGQILEAYKDSVFRDKHDGDPPVRGPFGEATIEVRPGVTPENNVHFS